MRADLERISTLINDYVALGSERNMISSYESEVAILRELLTSWQGLTSNEYQTDIKLHLNMLTTRALHMDDEDEDDDAAE